MKVASVKGIYKTRLRVFSCRRILILPFTNVTNDIEERKKGERVQVASYTREEVFMEGPLEPNMGPSLADVPLCTFESTNAGFSSFPLRKLLSWE